MKTTNEGAKLGKATIGLLCVGCGLADSLGSQARRTPRRSRAARRSSRRSLRQRALGLCHVKLRRFGQKRRRARATPPRSTSRIPVVRLHSYDTPQHPRRHSNEEAPAVIRRSFAEHRVLDRDV